MTPAAGHLLAFELDGHSMAPKGSSNALELVELVARRTAELVLEALEQHVGDAPNLDALVDAKTLADVLGVSRDHVYRHADELGAIRTGGALRFNLETATRRSESKRSQDVKAPVGKAMARPRAPRAGTGARRVPTAPMLPVGSGADRRRREAGG